MQVALRERNLNLAPRQPVHTALEHASEPPDPATTKVTATSKPPTVTTVSPRLKRR